VAPWRTRHGTVESTVRNWGKRFRMRWGLKYGRGIIMTPIRQSEMERKVFFPRSAKNNARLGTTFRGHFLTPKTGPCDDRTIGRRTKKWSQKLRHEMAFFFFCRLAPRPPGDDPFRVVQLARCLCSTGGNCSVRQHGRELRKLRQDTRKLQMHRYVDMGSTSWCDSVCMRVYV
jgi:hypothetical protein